MSDVGMTSSKVGQDCLNSYILLIGRIPFMDVAVSFI